MRFLNEIALDHVVLNADQISDAIDASYLLACSIQAVVSSGSASGTLKLQMSNDQPLSGSPTNWSDITNATVSVSGAGVIAILITDLAYQWIRVVYSDGSSGTATSSMTVHLAAKGF